MLRKAIYRLHKGGGIRRPNPVSVDWYRWMYAANREWGIQRLRELRDYCRENQIEFTLVLLPAGCAYRDTVYELEDMYEEIGRSAQKLGIDVVDCSKEWGVDEHAGLFDVTDHLTEAGNELMATTIANRLGCKCRVVPRSMRERIIPNRSGK
jgi:hypothetical protein